MSLELVVQSDLTANFARRDGTRLGLRYSLWTYCRGHAKLYSARLRYSLRRKLRYPGVSLFPAAGWLADLNCTDYPVGASPSL